MADEMTVKTEADYEQLIDGLGAVVLDMVLDFLEIKGMTKEELAAFNKQRLDGLGDWIAQRRAELKQ